MSQIYTIDVFQSGHVAQTDMANIKANFESIRSSFSDGTPPSNAIAGHLWFDTSDNCPKVRNDGNTAWIAILTGTNDQKLWIYRNDTDDGWEIDATVTDRVIAIKGGSGLYNVNGGNPAGESWATLKAHTHGMTHTHAHNHQWYENTGSTEDDETFESDGSSLDFDIANLGIDKTNANRRYVSVSQGVATDLLPDSYTDNDSSASSASNTGAQSTSDVRPAAAVGTLQYPDIPDI